jgi:hypothetical protein
VEKRRSIKEARKRGRKERKGGNERKEERERV